MPYCEQCGTECNEGYQFCENCGVTLVKTQPLGKHAPLRNYVWLIAIISIFAIVSIIASIPYLNKPFFGKAIIKTKTRKAIARVQIGGSRFCIDKGRLLMQENGSYANLPLIAISKDDTGIHEGSVCNSEQLRLAVSLLEKINARGKFKGKVTAIDATSKYDRLSFVMDNGIEIIMSKKDFAEKLKVLEMLFSGNRINPEQVEYIDLRFKDIVLKEKKKEATGSPIAEEQKIISYLEKHITEYIRERDPGSSWSMGPIQFYPSGKLLVYAETGHIALHVLFEYALHEDAIMLRNLYQHARYMPDYLKHEYNLSPGDAVNYLPSQEGYKRTSRNVFESD